MSQDQTNLIKSSLWLTVVASPLFRFFLTLHFLYHCQVCWWWPRGGSCPHGQCHHVLLLRAYWPIGTLCPRDACMFVRNCDFVFLISFIHLLFLCHQLINKGKGEALRIRAILRSLVPTEDLVGIISIPLKMPIVNRGNIHSMVII